MDLEYGLKLKIDDREPDTVDFAKKVKVLQARVLQLEDRNSLLSNHISDIQRLILVGPVSVEWFNEEISKFKHLTKLVLRGKFLHSNDLCPRGLEFKTSFYLPSLKSLELIINETSLPLPLPLSIRLGNPSRNAIHEERHMEKVLVGSKNMCYILMYLQSPKLSQVQLHAYQRPGFVLPFVCNWKNVPLETFLETHNDSIRELYLPEFDGKNSMDHEPGRTVPKKVKKLLLDLSRLVGGRDEHNIQNVEYWTELLVSQEQLKHLKLSLSNVTNHWLGDILGPMNRSNKATLKHVDLSIQSDDLIEVNGEDFQQCQVLEVLQLSCSENEVRFHNFNLLPPCLKKIKFSGVLVDLMDGQSAHNHFTDLIMLDLNMLSVDTINHDATLDTVRGLISIRTLNYFNLVFNESVERNESLKHIVDQFAHLWDPRFPYRGMKVNLDYELDEGWDDDVFEEEYNDRHYFNQQEPEEMSNWASRARYDEDGSEFPEYFFTIIPFISLDDRDDDDDDRDDETTPSTPSSDDY